VTASRTPVIVGIGLSDGPVAPPLDAVQHHVVAMRRALDDSGVRKADIDGYCCAGACKHVPFRDLVFSATTRASVGGSTRSPDLNATAT
jgi:hypothetical protein